MTAPGSTPPVARPRVAVVGAGISGLAAAHRLRTRLGPTAEITVLEARDRIGGVLRTVDLAGIPFDVGAEAFLARRPEVGALCAELGLTGQLVAPTSARAGLRVAGTTAALPGATLLGVPTATALAGDGVAAVLGPAGLAAARAEATLAPLDWSRGDDVALGGLLRARFGDAVVDRLVEPLLGGVYAGRVDALGLRATVPALAAALDAGAATLTAAATAATASAGEGETSGGRSAAALGAGGPVFGALRGGYRVLLDALLAASGAHLRLGTTVRALHRLPAAATAGQVPTAGPTACVVPRWRLELGPASPHAVPGRPGPETLDVDAVVLAVPAPALARLLAVPAPDAARAAAGIDLASSAVVALAFRRGDVSAPTGSGLLVAATEPLTVKGITHSSTKWAHLGADGLVRVRASVGRFGDTAVLQREDDDLLAAVRADLAAVSGLTAAPVATHVQRWGGGLPQYGVGHLARVAALTAALPDGLAVAGAALYGVGVPACLATADTAADVVRMGHTRADPHVPAQS